MLQASRALLLAGLLVLAGCSTFETGIGANSGFDDDRSRVVAPGVSDRGITDPELLLSAHQSWLQNQSYSIITGNSMTLIGGETYQAETVIRVGRERREKSWTHVPSNRSQVAPNTPNRVEGWTDGNRTFVKVTSNLNASYVRYPSDDHPDLVPIDLERVIRAYFPPAKTVVVETVEYDGWEAYRIKSSSESDFHDRKITATLTVDLFGFIHKLSIVYPGQTPSMLPSRADRVSITFTGVGTTSLSEPAWLPRAINSTDSPP